MPSTENGLDVRSYRTTGLAYPIPVLSVDEVDRYRAHCDELERRLGGKPRTIEVRQMHLHLPWACELATHPRVLDAVETILGPNLLVWATELFAKHPEDATISIEWHRDRPYMGFEGDGIATAWIALSDSDPGNGCMQALPGPERRFSERDDTSPVGVVLKAGEMSIHDADILHGSPPNGSARKRVGFVIRYVTPEACTYRDDAPMLVARGNGPQSGHRLVETPDEIGWDRTIAEMKKSAAAHFDAILQNLERTQS